MPKNSANLVSTIRAVVSAAREAQLSDGELLAEFVQRRDQSAFTALVRRHAGMVGNVCRRILGCQADVDDAVQATFVLLARKAAQLKHPEHVGAWLYAVARKVAARARSSSRRALPLAQDVKPSQDPLEGLSGREVLAILDEELARLPEDYRAVLVLCCLEGKSREEAARQLGCSEGSVKGRLERGRVMLSRRLSRRGFELATVLGVSLVWHTATAHAASDMITKTLEAASPRALALAHAVAGTLGPPLWISWTFPAALLATLTGVGVGIWSFVPATHTISTQNVPLAEAAQEQAFPESHTNEVSDRPRPQRGQRFTATLRGVDVESRQVILRRREVDRTLPLANGVQLLMDGNEVNLMEFATLGAKTRVEAILNPEDSEIVVLAAVGDLVAGVFIEANPHLGLVSIRRNTTDVRASPSSWPLAVGAQVTLNEQPATIAELRQGVSVLLRLSADGQRIVAIEAKIP